MRESTRKHYDKGYGKRHRDERRKWERIIAVDGPVPCACGAEDCREVIGPNDPFDLGHSEDRTYYTGPEVPAHNRRKGAQNSNRSQATARILANRPVIERSW